MARSKDYRSPCAFAVRITRPDGVFDGWIANAAATGARIDGVPRGDRGMLMTMSIAGRIHEARIVWSRENTTGVRFTEPLEDDALTIIHSGGGAFARQSAGRVAF